MKDILSFIPDIFDRNGCRICIYRMFILRITQVEKSQGRSEFPEGFAAVQLIRPLLSANCKCEMY